MNTSEYENLLDDLFERAKHLSLCEQARFLASECRDDQLRTELEGLLNAFQRAPKHDIDNCILPNDVIVNGLSESDLPVTGSANGVVNAGDEIGAYKLVQKIGEGGMGAVYLAEQTTPVKRRVAVKVIKQGMDTGQVLARFDAERQTLAMMDHPNIAKVFDAGETQIGRPYFVMELIEGVPLTQYCDEHRLSTQDRLKLFIPVTQAVAHAHQKAVIHRDLKPSNILVAKYDGRPVPKVIDFGVAKAVSEELTDRSLTKQLGQLVGTVEYMSPEQTKPNQFDVDTRSDIYSLGVVLYELLVGTTPFDKKRLRSAAFDEMVRIIREEDPPTPSSRVATNSELPSIAANRMVEPTTLSRLLRSDLDWIVMSCLEKDRSRRYQTARGIGEDLERYLNGDVVSARPPTWSYRLRKSVRRNKLLYASSAAVLASLLLGAFLSALQAERANKEADRAFAAEGEQQRARQDAELERDRALRTIYDAEMNRAKRNLDAQMFGPAKRTVDRYQRSDLRHNRGWEWQYLWQQTRSDELATIGRHDYVVDQVRFAPDGRRVVTAGQDQRMIIWDVDRRSRLAEIPTGSAIDALDVSPNGAIVSHCEDEDVLRFTVLPNGESRTPPTREVPLDEGMLAVKSLRFSSDGRWLAVLAENRLQLWDSVARALRKDIAFEDGRRLAFSPDSSILAVALKNRDVALLDSKTLERSTTLSYGAPVWETGDGEGGNLEFSRHGKWLAYAGGKSDKILVVWSLHDGRAHIVMEGGQYETEWVGQVAFAQDDSRMVSVGNDRKVSLWRWDEETSQWLLADSRLGHEGDIWALDVAPDGNAVVTGSSDGTVRLWSTAANRAFGRRRAFAGDQFVHTFRIGGQFLHDLAWGGRFAVVRKTNDLRNRDDLVRCDTRSGAMRTLPFFGDRAQISADGRLIAAEQEGVIRLYQSTNSDGSSWDEIQGPEVLADSEFESWEAGFRFSPRQKYLAIAKRDGAIAVWNIDDGSVVDLPTNYQKTGDIAFSMDESLLVATSHRSLASACEVFDLRRRQRVLHLDGGPGAFAAALVLPGNGVLATADEHASVSLWKLAAESPDSMPGQRYATFGEARAGLRAFACSPDGRLLVTVGAWDNEIHLWDAKTQQEVLVLSSELPVWSLGFSADGNTLTSACGVAVHRWEVPPLDAIDAAEMGADQSLTSSE